MQSKSTRHISFIRLLALALLGLCFVQPTARAQAPTEPVIAQTTLPDPRASSAGGQDSIWIDIGSPVGIVPGQKLRFSVFNPDGPGPVRSHVKVFDSHAVLITQSADVVIPAGEFRSIDVNREGLPRSGEPGTGRLQVHCQLLVAGQQTGLAQFPSSVELVDNSSGETVLLLPAVQISREVSARPQARTTATAPTGHAPDRSSNENDQVLVFFLGGVPLGFVRGQTMRITLVNPDQPQAPNGRRIRMLVTPLCFDAQGNVIAAGDEITLEPGEFHSFDFNRDDIGLAGEPGTGRLQVRTEVRCRTFSIVDRTRITPEEIPTSLELIDNRTGKTTAMVSQKPKEIVVVGSH